MRVVSDSSVPASPVWHDVSGLACALLGNVMTEYAVRAHERATLLQAACCALGDSGAPDAEIFVGCKEAIQLDVDAILNGDPAARSRSEVILAYPGFFAAAMYRFSHQLWLAQYHLLARMLSEYAHSRTGVDIHPGAQIGPSLCIDHGTGTVVGETTQIGAHAKLYQGVTLGAISVKKVMANSKRHPTLEDNVTVYANATILGGDTVIGHDSVIGGSVWLTHSVPPCSTVFVDVARHIITQQT